MCACVCPGQALAALFLMNNVHYIVKAVESSEALSCVGQDWIERHKDLIETYGEEYQARGVPFMTHLVCSRTPSIMSNSSTNGHSCMHD